MSNETPTYTPNLTTAQIDALLGAMLEEAPTGEEATRLVAFFERAWTSAMYVKAIEEGLVKLERGGDEDTWYVTNAQNERTWAIELPKRTAA
jgi:hypothetical protein